VLDLFASLHLAGRRLLVPGPVVAEVGYLLARTGGARAEAQFLTSLAERTFSTVELTANDYRRAAELVLTYEDLPLGTTDATVVAVCERLGSQRSPPSTAGTSRWCDRGTSRPSRCFRSDQPNHRSGRLRRCWRMDPCRAKLTRTPRTPQ
jgi:hypothetical protein